MCHNETELEDPKDLRAKVRKFLILTNERKQMSKTTLRKRIALTATTALFAGMLSVVAIPSASAANLTIAAQVENAHLLVATDNSTTGSAVLGAHATPSSAALSRGLLSKDASTATAQTATVLAGGALSLYAGVSTDAAFTATGGTFGSALPNIGGSSYSNDVKIVFTVVDKVNEILEFVDGLKLPVAV